MFKLRPYQEKAVQDCINYLNSNSYSKVAVVAPVAAVVAVATGATA